MAQLSPGIEFREIDQTNTTAAVSTSIGAYAGHFNWGPVEEIVTVSSEKELAQYFGSPVNDTHARSFLTAASFLKYSNSLRISRACDATLAKNAADGGAILIKNFDHFENLANPAFTTVSARYPGLLGNSISVEIASLLSTEPDGTPTGPEAEAALLLATANYNAWLYKNLFNSIPGQSLTVLNSGKEFNDEVNIVVIDVEGEITGTRGTVLEKFEGLSLVTNAKNEDGSSLYYKDYINKNSAYIYINTLSDIFTGADALVNSTTNIFVTTEDDSIQSFSLIGGLNGDATVTNVSNALDMFADKELVDINLLFAESFDTIATQVTIDNKLLAIADSRRDILATISAPLEIAALTTNAAKKAKVLEYFNAFTSSSFVTFSQTPVYMYNRFSDRYMWVPDGVHIAGLCAHTDMVADPWFSPAGFNRGQLRGVTKIAYNPNKADRDDLYKARVNSIVSIPGEGIVLYGDKTGLSKPSAFDRINVRRLFNVLTRTIVNASRYQLFELNDEFTRAAFVNLVDPFLRDVKGRRGIIDFRVVFG